MREGKPRKLGNYVYDMAPATRRPRQARSCGVRNRCAGPHRLQRPSPLRADDAGANRHVWNRTSCSRTSGIEPLSGKLQRRLSGQGAGRQEDAHQVGAAGPAGDRGAGQYLCLRGAVPQPTSRPSGWRARCKNEQIAPLVAAIKKVLKDAIAAGGSTLRDHAQATGDPGNFQHHFLVYGREGKPCKLDCTGTVKRIVQAGRSTFYCPKCQT